MKLFFYFFTLSLSRTQVITSAPVSSAATNVQQTSFTASWSTPIGASTYILDVSDNSFSSLIPGYPKPVNNTTDNVNGLTPGTIYQYRVRAINASGPSDNSNAISQITVPQTPTANTASSIRTNDFKAVWSNVLGETEYRLDVSQNNFSTYLTGFENKLIPADVTEETVTGLSPNTQYQYRVRAKNAGGVSSNSNVITATTLAGGGTSPLTISATQFPATLASGSTSVTINSTVTGGAGAIAAEIFYRAITGTAFTQLTMTNPSGNIFQAAIPAAVFDDLGLEFYVKAKDGFDTKETSKNYVYRSFAADQASSISTISKFGGTMESYQIISIPFQLEDNLISSIFEPALGSYDKTKWRLVRYQNERNTDYQSGLVRINQGESYWFNSVESIAVKPGAGKSPQFNQATSFVLKLARGWNQIATPFPFAIDWDDILAANGNPTGIGKYKVYYQNSISFSETNSLQPYSGGFVFADAAQDLNLPVTLKNTAGGRKGLRQKSSDISGDEWLLPIELIQGKAINQMGGIGMHPQAKVSKDDFDDITLPRFVKHLEFNSYHHDFFAPRFSRDVVYTANEHAWKITIESNFDEGNITLDWADSDLGINKAQLLLYDPKAQVLIDMKQIKNYSLSSASIHIVQILYFHEKKLDINSSMQLGKPFPNPSSGEVMFNLFSVSSSKARLEIFDLMGRKIHHADYSTKGNEINSLQWSGADLTGQKAAAGLYLYKLITYSDGSPKTSQGRIIIR